MAQKLWRVVRACVDLGPKNPIQQIHDQGAGGNCNVVGFFFYIQVKSVSACQALLVMYKLAWPEADS